MSRQIIKHLEEEKLRVAPSTHENDAKTNPRDFLAGQTTVLTFAKAVQNPEVRSRGRQFRPFREEEIDLFDDGNEVSGHRQHVLLAFRFPVLSLVPDTLSIDIKSLAPGEFDRGFP